MRRAGLGLVAVVALSAALVACTSEAPATSDEGTGDDEPGPSYAECTVNGEPSCIGVECAADPDAVHWIELIEDELAERGWSDRVFVVSAETVPATNQVLVSVIQEVGWYRSWAPINGLRTDVNDLEFRSDVSIWLDGVDVPSSVIPHQDVLDAFAACDPDLVYDPCTSHRWSEGVYAKLTYSPVPNCVEDLVTLHIDVGSGEVTCDLDPPQVGCG